MSLDPHSLAIDTFIPMLRTLSVLLERGEKHADATQSDASALVNARLAADMYTLAQQVQLACFHAKDATARLCGGAPEVPEEAESTLLGLRARIARTVVALEQVPPDAFAGAAERPLEVALGGDMVLAVTGAELLRDWSIPHFYFHVVTAYDILRHNGVVIGKQDYLGHVGRFIRTKKPS